MSISRAALDRRSRSTPCYRLAAHGPGGQSEGEGGLMVAIIGLRQNRPRKGGSELWVTGYLVGSLITDFRWTTTSLRATKVEEEGVECEFPWWKRASVPWT